MNAFSRLVCLTTLLLTPSTRAQSSDHPLPLVILISIDGCRWDYVSTFAPPVLSHLAQQGVRAERMISSFPSSTFPNHYTIVTGLRPEHHGIISNNMYDPAFDASFALSRNPGPREGRWWGGEPIWATARKQGLRTACMFWPGSEAEIAGVRPDLYLPYNQGVTSTERAQTVLEWLRLPPEQRPQFITLYFDVVDTTGHTDGPASPEAREALLEVDLALGQLIAGIRELGLEDQVNFVVTSDHGMTRTSTQRRVVLDDYVDLTTVRIDFDGAYAGLRPLTGTADELYAKFSGDHPGFKAYRREEMPAALHYRDHLRIPPVVLVGELGWSIETRATFDRDDRSGWGHGGAHGYDPRELDMGATFIAAGPSIQSARVIPPFDNIHVYDLLCTLLDLQPAPNDGDHRLAHQVLRP